MKIGLLTYYADFNCGTNLQAYATMVALQRVFPGDDVEIIEFQSFKQKFRPYLTSFTFETIFNDFVKLFKYKRFWCDELKVGKVKVIRNVDKALDYINSKEYDRIYVGADTILELDRLDNNYDGLTAFWLSLEIRSDKYFISSSCKNVEYDKLSSKQKTLMQETLNDFKAFFVRDKITEKLFSRFIESERITISPDPTFYLGINHDISEAYWTRKYPHLKGQKIVCFHTLRGEIWPLEFARELKEQGYVVASLRTASWADIILNDLSPFEQLGIYRYFTCMITHRFHDSIFCLKNNTPVITYALSNDYIIDGESKYYSLFSLFNLQNVCLINNRNTINPDMIMSKMGSVINIFNERRDEITSKCKLLGMKYIENIEKTY